MTELFACANPSPLGVDEEPFVALASWLLRLLAWTSTIQEARLPFSVPARLNAFVHGAGIFACFPSPTPFGLGLGTD